MAKTDRSETWDTEQVLAYVHDVRPWKQLTDREKIEWCRRVKYVRDNVTTDGETWTLERLAGLFGITRPSLSERFTRAEAISDSGDHVQPRKVHQRASDTRRYLSDPDIDPSDKAEVVAEVVMNDPELEAAITRAQTERALERRSETAKKKATDQVGQKFEERIALHELQAETSKYVKKARTLIPEIGLIPDAERFWLKGEADGLEDIAAELRHMAEHGQTRQETELQKIVETG